MLKNLGWSLTRVWTIDWWDNRERVINRLLAKLDALKAEAERKIEEAKATEEARKAEEADRENEAARVKAELENQAAEVLAEDEEAEKEQTEKKQRAVETQIHPVAESATASGNETENKTEDETGTQAAKESEEEEKSEVLQSSQAENDSHNETEALPENDPLVGLLQKIADAKCRIIDKRQNGGALWIVGGKNLSPIMNEFKGLGVHFIFKAGGGKATGGKDGWWAKTDIVLPDLNKKPSISERSVIEDVSAVKPETIEDIPVKVSEDVNAEDTAEQEQDSNMEETVHEESKETEEKPAKVQTQEDPVDYVEANLPVTNVSQSEFAAVSNKKEISNRILAVLEVEAPILKESLFRRIWTSFNIQKTTAAIEATEKAMKAAKVKTSRQKGIVYCWAPGQDPKEYTGIRISNTRSGNEICQQEIKNAACYVLKNKGELSKDDLIKEVSLLFGYKRLGKKLETALAAGVQYARTSGGIVSVAGRKYAVAPEEDADDDADFITVDEDN